MFTEYIDIQLNAWPWWTFRNAETKEVYLEFSSYIAFHNILNELLKSILQKAYWSDHERSP